MGRATIQSICGWNSVRLCISAELCVVLCAVFCCVGLCWCLCVLVFLFVCVNPKMCVHASAFFEQIVSVRYKGRLHQTPANSASTFMRRLWFVTVFSIFNKHPTESSSWLENKSAPSRGGLVWRWRPTGFWLPACHPKQNKDANPAGSAPLFNRQDEEEQKTVTFIQDISSLCV